MILKRKIFGFTLLELLIVIAIIAVLTSISFVALNGARKQGRDGRRKSDLETIRAAIELYKADCNTYPASLPAVDLSITGNTPPCAVGVSNVYLRRRPGDPSGITFGSYSYTALPVGGPYTSYTLCSKLEDPPTSPDVVGCGSCNSTPPTSGTCHGKVTNP